MAESLPTRRSVSVVTRLDGLALGLRDWLVAITNIGIPVRLLVGIIGRGGLGRRWLVAVIVRRRRIGIVRHLVARCSRLGRYWLWGVIRGRGVIGSVIGSDWGLGSGIYWSRLPFQGFQQRIFGNDNRSGLGCPLNSRLSCLRVRRSFRNERLGIVETGQQGLEQLGQLR